MRDSSAKVCPGPTRPQITVPVPVRRETKGAGTDRDLRPAGQFRESRHIQIKLFKILSRLSYLGILKNLKIFIPGVGDFHLGFSSQRFRFLKTGKYFSETKLGSGSGDDEGVVGEGFLSNAATTQCGFSLGGEKV